MTGKKPPEDLPREREKPATPENGSPPPAAPAPAAANALTPEEQMEKFAEELKENDWGHQPC